MNKAVLRKSIAEHLHRVTPETRRTASEFIVQSLVSLPEFVAAETVLLFASLPREPDVELLWKRSESHGKRLVYPRVEGSELGLYEALTPKELAPGRWGLREPVAVPERRIFPVEIDFATVPGVAFTPSGERLGRGGGYYDRLLATATKAFKVGVCFDFQVLSQLPIESHDIVVDRVVTEHG